ncbi:hypothetical protein OOZ51_14330 [Arthrobacter sp. MI7-26]|uniref:hypothetical protein n=1 Tax=Arthrobacter sp. MI7-26 TaxID=2993653 RepID=UPI002248EC24|nr:hypothetical protein [Arthrobacter sp. MI7-26]MCX2748982.1 hypothetical protein [Arthrobacter sp. MI7-26]
MPGTPGLVESLQRSQSSLNHRKEIAFAVHVGGASSAMFPRMVRLIKKQISLLQAGEAPVNVVLGKEAVAG